jgi:hypothetical protein
LLKKEKEVINFDEIVFKKKKMEVKNQNQTVINKFKNVVEK